MTRSKLLLGLLLCLLPLSVAHANDVSGLTGAGLQTGLSKMTGGERDYSNLDEHFGLHFRRGLSPHWSLEAALKYGWARPAAEPGEDAGYELHVTEPFYTVIWQPRLGILYHLAPDERVSPYLGAAVEASSWKTIDRTGLSDPGHFMPPDGEQLSGYDENGDYGELKSTDLAASVSAGLEIFVLPSMALNLGARYHQFFGNKLDNIGLSALHGAEHVDANNSQVEGFVGFTWFFGSRDRDGDGIADEDDACPDEPEDFDDFEDADGCPDPDNDGDGILDGQDGCPNDADDRDGFEDADGCPDTENDGDGVLDADDSCPDVAEDRDGFEDEDGCPDPDNDGDGVLDGDDDCPGTASGVRVDERGCPIVEEIKAALVLKGVHFANDSDEITPESGAILDEVVESLRAYPEVQIQIQGHTDTRGSEAHNRDLSQRRAEAVRAYFIEGGVEAERMTAVGFGESQPVADNTTPGGRAENRRVELHRIGE